MKKRKIIATLGPTSLKKDIVNRMDSNGVDIFRLNLSHTKIDDLRDQLLKLKEWTNKTICLDTEGKQLRTGELKNNTITIKGGSTINLLPINSPIKKDQDIPLSVTKPWNILSVGDLLSIDFNSVVVQIIDSFKKHNVIGRVIIGGLIGSNKGIYFENEKFLPAFTEKDLVAFKIVNDLGIDVIALSFASDSKSIKQLRQFFDYNIDVIAKIENDLGLKKIGEICKACDSLIIDRGDLSRYVPIEKIIFAQEYIIKCSNRFSKEVFVATNLMESMVNNLQPTRAEIHDIVACLNNDVYGLVLAAETAIGKYPVETVRFISRIINEVDGSNNKTDLKYLTTINDENLILPHGGKLIQQHINDFDEKIISSMPHLEVDEKTLSDIVHIAEGSYSPLKGFMNLNTVKLVLEKFQLPNGVPWTLPIIFQGREEHIKTLPRKGSIAIRLRGNNEVIAILQIQNIERMEKLDQIAQKWFGTSDNNHIGVKQFTDRGDHIISGKPYLIKKNYRGNSSNELFPIQTRQVFSDMNWQNIVGFHTRNVIHYGHEFIQKQSLKLAKADAILISPVVGEKKRGDFSSLAIIECYNKMIENGYYQPFGAILSAFNTYSRYAGPREAVFTAICRKNFGCNYFIIGRDHTGLDNYYTEYASQEIFDNIDLGINILCFNRAYFCNKCQCVVDQCNHANKFHTELSGTKIRQALLNSSESINVLMRSDIAELLNKIYNEKPNKVLYQ